jgi:phosphoribosylformylglycinamidine cyclo-ligase
VDHGVYVLTSSIAGIVERSKVIDGSAIREGDAVLAVASNGLHTNGYSLVRLLMDKQPQIKTDKIGGMTFIEQIMKPHSPYYKAVRDLFGGDSVHGMAHITGGGIEGNLCRVIPKGLSAKIDLSKIKIPDLFKFIRDKGNISDDEMFRTFNCGVGFIIVTSQKDKSSVIRHVKKTYDCFEIGTIKTGGPEVEFEGRPEWV